MTLENPEETIEKLEELHGVYESIADSSDSGIAVEDSLMKKNAIESMIRDIKRNEMKD